MISSGPEHGDNPRLHDEQLEAALLEGTRNMSGPDSVEAQVAARLDTKLVPSSPTSASPAVSQDEYCLRLRVQAQRLAMCKLGRGLPVSAALLELVRFGPRSETASNSQVQSSHSETVQASGPAVDPRSGDGSEAATLASQQGQFDLLDQFTSALQECGSQTAEERKQAIRTRIQHRILELTALLDNLPHEVKLKALLELKQLQHWELQQRLRSQVVVEKWILEDSTPTLLLDWSRLRAGAPGRLPQERPLYVPQPSKPIPLRQSRAEAEADVSRCRQSEEKRKHDLQEQHNREMQIGRLQMAIEADRKRKYNEEHRRIKEYDARMQAISKRREFLEEVSRAANARVQVAGTRDNPSKRKQQRNLAVKSWHSKEKRNLERVANARVLALKSHNYEEYLRLARNAKDDRLRMLLHKTDAIMHELGMKIKTQRRAGAGEVEIVEDDDWEKEREGLDDVARLIQGQQNYYGLVHQIKEKITHQPAILKGGSLRAYQMDGLMFLVSLFNNKMNGILADEMGLGKTVQTVGMLAYLLETKQNKGPHLILAPKAVLSNWQNEFDKWLPGLLAFTYDGTPDERKNLRLEYIEKGTFNAIITHYDLAIRDKAIFRKINWEVLIVDEGHRLKNADSKLFSLLSSYSFKTRMLLTGTPVQNSLNELWALLNFLLPKVFHSSETFDEWFAAPFKGQSEDVCQLKEEEQLLIINRLHQVIRPFMLRRTKVEVEKELPSKTEHIIKCDMSAWQKFLYEQITAEGQVMHESGKIKRLSNLSMHLRKACNHPYLMADQHYTPEDPEELVRSSGKLDLLDRILPKLQKTGHRVLLFSQMTRALDMVEDLLVMRKYKYLRLDGSTKTDDRATMLQDFNRDGSDFFIFMLSTRAGGLGLNLQTADTVIMFDSDWNPAMDQQAEDRAHRIGQKKEVLVLILVCAGTIEEAILDKAHKKRDIDAKVIQAGMFNDKSTNSERQQALEAILRRGGLHLAGHLSSDEEINEKLARSEEEFALFEQMDAELKASQASTRPRLMAEEELPAWVMQPKPPGPQEQREEDEHEEGDGRRTRRAKKHIFYADPLNDTEFERLMMKGATEEDMDLMREINRAEMKRKREAEPGRDGSKHSASRPTPSKKRLRSSPDAEEDTATNGASAYTHSRKSLRSATAGARSTRSSSKLDEWVSDSGESEEEDDIDDDERGTHGVTISDVAHTRGEASDGGHSTQEESAMSEVQTPSKPKGRGRGRGRGGRKRGRNSSQAVSSADAGRPPTPMGVSGTVGTGFMSTTGGKGSWQGSGHMEGVEHGDESMQETGSSLGRGRGRGRRGRNSGRATNGRKESGREQQHNNSSSSPPHAQQLAQGRGSTSSPEMFSTGMGRNLPPANPVMASLALGISPLARNLSASGSASTSSAAVPPSSSSQRPASVPAPIPLHAGLASALAARGYALPASSPLGNPPAGSPPGRDPSPMSPAIVPRPRSGAPTFMLAGSPLTAHAYPHTVSSPPAGSSRSPPRPPPMHTFPHSPPTIASPGTKLAKSVLAGGGPIARVPYPVSQAHDQPISPSQLHTPHAQAASSMPISLMHPANLAAAAGFAASRQRPTARPGFAMDEDTIARVSSFTHIAAVAAARQPPVVPSPAAGSQPAHEQHDAANQELMEWLSDDDEQEAAAGDIAVEVAGDIAREAAGATVPAETSQHASQPDMSATGPDNEGLAREAGRANSDSAPPQHLNPDHGAPG